MVPRPDDEAAGPTVSLGDLEAAISSTPPIEVGDLLAGRFSILRRIGEGGAGAVYAARDLLLGEDVALKVLRRAGLGAHDGLRRLRDEVRAARRIAHPNVCRVHDLAETDGRVFVVMELLSGVTLRDRIRQGVSVGEGLDILRQLAAGLGAAHRAGVVHCDVKPENAIFAGPGGPRPRVALTDFGIARIAGPELGDGEPAVEGTPAYMAPEQLSGEPVDERTDVFALAILACEMLTGAHPYGLTASNTFLTLSRRVLTEAPTVPGDRPAELDAEARAALTLALEKGLAREPAARWDSPGELVAALAAAAGPHLAARPAPSPTPPTTTQRTPEARRPSTGARGVRRLATIAHVAVGMPALEEDDDRAVERVEAMLDVAEAALVDAGGTVVARLPRALVSAFGAARSAGDEPQRAAAAVRAIVAAAPRDLAVRAGIDTGRLLVRQAPSGALTVAGDAVERAAALAGAAAAGEALASERTARHLARRFLLEAAGTHASRIGARRRAGDDDPRGLPLLGREPELARVVDALAAAALGRPRGVLLLGPPGVGKTRLRREATFALASRGFQVAAAGAAPDDALAPFSVLRTLLRELLAVSPRPDDDEAVAAARRVTTEVALCSALASLLGAGAAPAAGPAQAAARAALTAASAQRPILLVVDDAHWADDATLELLESLARGAVEAPIAVLAEARPDLLDRRPRAAEAYGLRLDVAPLLPERARELAALCLGAAATPELIAAVVDAAEGNPFHVEELARDLVERGGRGGGAPTTVEAAIQARLDRVSSEARELLRAAAVVGSSFRRAELVPLAETAGFDPAALDALLEELEGRRVISALPPDASCDDRYEMRHSLVRDVAYRELAPAARRALHAACARLATADAERARHLEGADDRAAAAAAYRAAGEQALAQGAPAEALRSLDRARGLAGGDADAELLVTLAAAALDAGDFAECERTLVDALLRTGEGAAARRTAARACHVRAALAKQRAAWPEAIAAARRGLALVADGEEPVLAALLHGALGWVQGYILGDIAAGLAECLRAVELLAGTEHLHELGIAHGSLGAIYMRAGRWRDQLRCNRKNLEIGERLASLELQARANLNLGVNLASLGETAESIAASRRALALYDRMCVPASAGLARNNLAIALVDAGELDEAERQVAEAQRLSQLFGGLYYAYETELTRARLARRRGDLASARAHAEASATLAAGSPIDAATARRALAALLSMGGDHEGARRKLDEAAATLGDADLGEAARIVAERGRVALRRGDVLEADALLADAEKRLAALGAALDLEKLRDPDWV